MSAPRHVVERLPLVPDASDRVSAPVRRDGSFDDDADFLRWCRTGACLSGHQTLYLVALLDSAERRAAGAGGPG